MSSPKAPAGATNFTGVIYDEPQAEMTNMPPAPLEQKRRKYSVGMYEYTKHQWENVRANIDERSKTDSTSASGSTRSSSLSSDSSGSSAHKPNNNTIAAAAELLGSVPAVH